LKFADDGIGFPIDESSFLEDIKPIGVAYCNDGNKYRYSQKYGLGDNYKDEVCVPWDFRVDPILDGYTSFSDYWSSDTYITSETDDEVDQMIDDSNVWVWDSNLNRHVRGLSNKIAVVAPAENLSITSVGYIGVKGGTSIAIANVSGVIGLMTSIDKNLGVDVEYKDNGKAIPPPYDQNEWSSKRHQKAYNIVT